MVVYTSKECGLVLIGSTCHKMVSLKLYNINDHNTLTSQRFAVSSFLQWRAFSVFLPASASGFRASTSQEQNDDFIRFLKQIVQAERTIVAYLRVFLDSENLLFLLRLREEMSKPQVTITLGRSGQVVKRPVAVDSYRSDNGGPLSGNKRSIRDRLGNQSINKRQRKDGNMGSGNDNVDGIPVRKDDLRFKLQRKNMSRRTLSNGGEIDMDLREKLSRTTQPPSRYDTRERVPEPGRLRRIPPTRSADDLLHMDSLRKSYSAWDLDKLRRRSPDRFVSTSRGVSPPRDMEQRRQVRHVEASRPVVSSRPVVPSRPVDSSRPLDTSRSTAYTSKDIYSGSRPTPYLTKSAVPIESAKPVARHPPPSTSGVMPKTHSGEEPLTVAGLLTSLGLGKYAILFQAEEVDMTALKQMGDQDLKELGIPMGPRKKILLAVMPRMKRKP